MINLSKMYEGIPLVIQFYLKRKLWGRGEGEAKLNQLVYDGRPNLLGIKSLFARNDIQNIYNRSQLYSMIKMMSWETITNIY
jgi:hypothetical protein